MSKQLTITIDGKDCVCETGEQLLAVAKRNQVFIPTLCYHAGLPGLGACRLCIVEVIDNDRSQVVSSCLYPVEKEIVVLTQSPKIKEQRGLVITLLHHLAPNSDTISNMAKALGFSIERLIDKPHGDKCILCGRCTAACELLGTGAIAKVGRGVEKRVATPYDQMSPECIGCASCANVCPTGKISYQTDGKSITIWGKTFDYLQCSRCGAYFVTREQYEYEYQRLKKELPGSPLCDECKQAATAQSLQSGSLHLWGVKD